MDEPGLTKDILKKLVINTTARLLIRDLCTNGSADRLENYRAENDIMSKSSREYVFDVKWL